MEASLHRKPVNVKLINNYLYYLNEREAYFYKHRDLLINKFVNIEEARVSAKKWILFAHYRYPVRIDRIQPLYFHRAKNWWNGRGYLRPGRVYLTQCRASLNGENPRESGILIVEPGMPSRSPAGNCSTARVCIARHDKQDNVERTQAGGLTIGYGYEGSLREGSRARAGPAFWPIGLFAERSTPHGTTMGLQGCVY